MKKRLITLTLSLVGIFFWGCEKQEEITPNTVSAISEQNTETYPEKKCCTRTQGYWKNHCEDYTWYYIKDEYNEYKKGCKATFYKSYKSYYDVLTTPPKHGNVYYILAHQFIAAKLNLLYCKYTYCKDVEYCKYAPPKVIYAYKKADEYFCKFKPDDKCSDEEREHLIWIAGILDKYNNGEIGPGHCDEKEEDKEY